MSIVYMLLCFKAIIDVFLCGLLIMQALDSNIMIYPLIKPYTNNTSSIKRFDLLPIIPLPMILPLLLSPKVTNPLSWLVSLEN